ncbi:bifunctional RNase H/acid phosphatase [Streptomyces chilikensis]|uniref:bifunctional RNase H/acid phosphatase n=1 Tax=Streptomyces chilikensis TaxID=1194079 RepID=UPI001409BB45|nr:bifunctional RNase H/acid phosphatase [Streptomyces chilikensis]
MREFVIEADGGSRGNPGPAGYGAVVADAATGEVLAETAEYLGVTTNNVAEYSGLIAGLRAVRELAAAELAAGDEVSVRVRMDSKLVVEQMSGRWKIKHPGLAPLAERARGLLPPERVTYEWIPRKENKHADRLANEAMDAGARGEAWMPSGRPAPTEKHLSDLRAAANVAAGPADAARPGWSAPDLGAPATFVLLRHGETPLTPQKRFSGSGGTDPSLSGTGLEQARRAAGLLAARGTVQAIVSSPLARTRETAAVVADRLGLDVTVDEGLRETDFGAWEGLTFAEVMDRHPDDLNAWLTSPDARPTGGGESFAATAARVEEARDRLIAAHAGRTVLLVTHVTPIKTLVRLALGAPPESLFRMELSAASISAVAHYADGNASLRLFNDTSHLR